MFVVKVRFRGKRVSTVNTGAPVLKTPSVLVRLIVYVSTLGADVVL